MNAIRLPFVRAASQLAALTVITTASAGGFSLETQAVYGGPALDFPDGILATPDGGFLLACTSSSPPGPQKAAPARGDEDFWLLRLGADLTRVWDVSFGGSEVDSVFDLAPTDDGGAILAGRSASSTDGNKTSANFGGSDVWVVRVDGGGNKVWDRSFGGIGTDGAIAIRQLNGNRFLVAGYSDSPPGTRVGEKQAASYGAIDMYVLCLDAEGAQLWEASFGGPSGDICRDITILADGTLLLSGFGSSPPLGNKTAPWRGEEDLWVVAINSQGEKLWDRSYGGAKSEYLDTGSVLPSEDGGFSLLAPSNSFSPDGRTQGYFLRCDAAGGIVASNILAHALDVIPSCLAPSSAGHFVAFANVFLNQDQVTGYPVDLLLWKLDTGGKVITERQFGGKATEDWSSNDWAKNIHSLGQDRFLLASTSYSEPGEAKAVPSLGGGDVWLMLAGLAADTPPPAWASHVIAWGYNFAGQTNVPPGLSNAVAVAGGWAHSLALQAEGTVVAWGNNVSGQTSVPAGLENVVAIASGQEHSLALRGDGTVVAWGRNDQGQTKVPPGLSNVVAVACGWFHNLALRADGTVVTWGDSSSGQAWVLPASHVVAIAAGWSHDLTLQADGGVLAWGNSPYDATSVPSGLSQVRGVAAGWAHSLALRTDGTMAIWGSYCHSNSYSTRFPATVPVGLTNIVAVAAGGYHSLALRADGTLAGWGGDTYGQPKHVPEGLSNVVAVAGGLNHSLAIIGPPQARIFQQPASRTNSAGTSAWFGVAATGRPPLTYQWRFDGTDLVDGNNVSGATRPTLVLTGVQGQQAGLYSVVVTNSAGNVTSTDATLTVLATVPPVPPPVLAPTLQGNTFRVSFAYQPGVTYLLQATADLTPTPVWDSLVAAEDVGLLTDPDATLPSRYYRLKAIRPDGGEAYSVNAVGYVRRMVQTGTNLLANPLAGRDNTIGTLLPNCPDGSRVLKYTGFGFDVASYDRGAWDAPQTILLPGEGAIFENAGAPFEVAFVGEVPQGTLSRPMPLGMVLLSSIAPVNGLLGFPAQDGDIIQTWDSTRRTLLTHTFAGLGGWDIPPVIHPGEAFWVMLARAANWIQDFVLNRPAGVETPFIYRHPASREANPGTRATFSVAANGTAPLAYQWRFNDAEIAGETNSVYAIGSVQLNHRGQYSVVVTNPYGSVTSVEVTLAVEGGSVPAAAWEGTDDFSSGISAAHWTVKQANTGQMTVAGANGHASFLVLASSAAEQNAYIVWRGTPTVAEDWIVDLTGHNSAFYPSCQLQLAVVNTEAWNDGAVEGFVVGMMNKLSVGMVGTSWWHYPGGWTSRARIGTTSTDFKLRLVYRAASQTVEAWHDPTASGQGWTRLDSMTVNEMSPGMATTNTFSFAILGNTDYGPISEGEIWADDFRITGAASPPPALATGREWHTATSLPNGQVLVAGGYTGGFPDGTYPATAELYDPATGNWTATSALGNPRGRHTATLLPNGRVLVAGGAGPGGVLTSAELYDPATGVWTATGPLGTARAVHSATLLVNGKVLVAGGTSDGATALASAELYDPATGTWIPTGPMGTARCYPGAVLLCDGPVLVAGGAVDARGNASLSSCEIYDPVARTWTLTSPMATDRQVHSVTVLPDGRVLAAGGEDSQENRLASAEIYDPANGTWTPTAALANGRKWHTANLLPSGRVVVAGGAGNRGYPAEVELYDPATGKWTTGGTLNPPRYWHTGILLRSGKVLIAGGGTGDNPAVARVELVDLPAGTVGPVVFENVVMLPGGAFHFGFRNTPGLGFSVLSTTGLGGPAVNWTFRGAATEFCPGRYDFADDAVAKDAQRFYRVVTLGP